MTDKEKELEEFKKQLHKECNLLKYGFDPDEQKEKEESKN